MKPGLNFVRLAATMSHTEHHPLADGERAVRGRAEGGVQRAAEARDVRVLVTVLQPGLGHVDAGQRGQLLQQLGQRVHPQPEAGACNK